jgi:hypothetical protein
MPLFARYRPLPGTRTLESLTGITYFNKWQLFSASLKLIRWPNG